MKSKFWSQLQAYKIKVRKNGKEITCSTYHTSDIKSTGVKVYKYIMSALWSPEVLTPRYIVINANNEQPYFVIKVT